jgi:hypothetical protein
MRSSSEPGLASADPRVVCSTPGRVDIDRVAGWTGAFCDGSDQASDMWICGKARNAAASLAPMVMGRTATAYSVAAGLPLLAVSFLLLVPLFIWFAPDMTRKELLH